MGLFVFQESEAGPQGCGETPWCSSSHEAAPWWHSLSCEICRLHGTDPPSAPGQGASYAQTLSQRNRSDTQLPHKDGTHGAHIVFLPYPSLITGINKGYCFILWEQWKDSKLYLTRHLNVSFRFAHKRRSHETCWNNRMCCSSRISAVPQYTKYWQVSYSHQRLQQPVRETLKCLHQEEHLWNSPGHLRPYTTEDVFTSVGFLKQCYQIWTSPVCFLEKTLASELPTLPLLAGCLLSMTMVSPNQKEGTEQSTISCSHW